MDEVEIPAIVTFLSAVLKVVQTLLPNFLCK